ncbi:unnamed protein product [Ectocarpus sp. CCAP 1310/34]|nr:unnamed protein product [Ectocarpus sp. CCAP 1310/34]
MAANRSREHMGPLALRPRNGRRGESAEGGTLKMNIVSCLKPNEADILAMLLEAVKHSKTGTVVRVAGGWVRDKLLGLENEDIDIALDNCTGVAFAETVNAYLKSQGRDEGKVAVIEANPEQSKHLETARMKIMGVWVDLVNLRTEVYRSDSRIPETSLGTAEEDALRRDFTLNALFYNVNEGKVEDKTGRGVNDLRDGIIRTPLSPMITFRDDPLRVLRAVRFAARFGFALHEDLRAAARDSEIQAALGTKVSRERVGTELCGMITGKMAQPALALSLLQDLGLAAAVYAPPEHLVPPPADGTVDWERGAAVARAAARLLEFRSSVMEAREEEVTDGAPPPAAEAAAVTVARAEGAAAEAGLAAGASSSCAPSAGGRVSMRGKPGSSDGRKEAPTTLVRELFLCAALLPLAGMKHKAKKGKLVSAAYSVVADSLKLKSKEAKNVEDILGLLKTFRSLADAYVATATSPGTSTARKTEVEGTDREERATFSRLSVGLAVRQAKELWPTCLDLCCAVEMCEPRQQAPPSPSPPPTTTMTTTTTGTIPACPAAHREQTVEATAVTSSVGSGPPPAAGGEEDEPFREGGKERAVIYKYAGLRKAAASMGLERAWDMAPLARGNELMAELQLPKGPEIGKLMAKQASWQLEHPEGTREQCVAFLRATL